MEAILDELPQSIKEKTWQCILAKELWVILKNLYLVKEIVVAIHTVSKDENEESSKDEGSKDKSDGEFDLEAKLIYSLEEIEKYRRRNKYWKGSCQNTKKSWIQKKRNSRPSKKSCTIQNSKWWLAWKRLRA